MKALIKKILGEELTGVIDYHRHPKMGSGMGGPFNAQVFRQKIFGEVMQKIKFAAIVETGSFHGTTSEYMFKNSGLTVYTVESQPRNYGFTKTRFRKNPGVKPHLGDSRQFLRDLTRNQELQGKHLFFYLDAHWSADLPLREEIEIIYGTWPDAVIMIDDFQVPTDSDYRYDDYGVGKSLTLDYLSPLRNMKLAAFFPSARGADETGAKRGCILLAKDAASVASLQSLPSLAAHGLVQ